MEETVQGSPEMKSLHELLDAQSHLVMHPLMGLYIAAPFTEHVPLVNYKFKRLLELRHKLWTFLQTQVEVIERREEEEDENKFRTTRGDSRRDIGRRMTSPSRT